MKKQIKGKNLFLKTIKIILAIIIILSIIGGIGVGSYFLIKLISLKWFIFLTLAVLIPFGVANLKRIAFKKGNYTKEQNRQVNARVIIYTLFYWLCDLFYMAIIINNLTCKFVFGGLIMIIVFYNLSQTFIQGKISCKFGLVQDFLIGVGLSVYLIYVIPNTDLQSIIIPIVAGVYGGLLTLVGVAWTIKENEDKHKKENNKFEIFKYMLGETIKKCTVEEFYFQNEIFYEYIYPKIDGNKPPKDDFITSRISKSPFAFDREIVELSLSGSIDDKFFVLYTKLKSTYESYVETKIIFYDKPECYSKTETDYRESLAEAKKILE